TVCRIIVWVGYLTYGLIKPPIVFEPSAPEPVEVFAGYIFDGPEEIIRRGVFVCPAVQVSFESTVKSLRPENFVPKEGETESRLEIGQDADVAFLHALRGAHNGFEVRPC